MREIASTLKQTGAYFYIDSYDNKPVIYFDKQYYKCGMILFTSPLHRNIRENYLDLLLSYRLKRTNMNVPYLKYKDFIWKDNIIYSNSIPEEYINEETIHEGPIGCIVCRHSNYEHEINYFNKYCSWCKNTIKKRKQNKIK